MPDDVSTGSPASHGEGCAAGADHKRPHHASQPAANATWFDELDWQPGAPSRTAACGAPHTTASGRARADRAAQFMPFAALRGYYELLRQEARVPEPKHELSEEEARELSNAVGRVRPRQMVRVVYYDHDAYATMTGCVTHIDLVERKLVIVKTYIALDDIRELEILDGT